MVHIKLSKNNAGESISNHISLVDVAAPTLSSIDWQQRGMVSAVRNQVDITLASSPHFPPPTRKQHTNTQSH